MNNKTTESWKQTLTLKDSSNKVVDSYTWECERDSESNTDGFTDAWIQFGLDDDLQDEAFDALVIDQETSWTDGNITVEISPVGKL